MQKYLKNINKNSYNEQFEDNGPLQAVQSLSQFIQVLFISFPYVPFH